MAELRRFGRIRGFHPALGTGGRAEQYELHVYRYYEDGVTTKKVVKETKLTDTRFDVTEEHKLDKQYTYYYYVVAKNRNFTSEPSGRVMVYDVVSPEITGVSDHSGRDTRQAGHLSSAPTDTDISTR